MSSTNPLFRDPVTWELMSDPVVCSDGYTYDRTTLEKLKPCVSPFSRRPMQILVDNVPLRGEIFEAFPDQHDRYRRQHHLPVTPRPPAASPLRRVRSNSDISDVIQSADFERLSPPAKEMCGFATHYFRTGAYARAAKTAGFILEMDPACAWAQALRERALDILATT